MKLRIRPPADPSTGRASDSPLETGADVLAEGIDWSVLFGAERPVELEIGCGKGWFITRVAAAHLDVSWFGIDYSGEHLRRAIDRARKTGAENVRFARTVAEDLLSSWIPDASLRAVHILYPDPWPKKRHHKRRLLGVQRGPKSMKHLARVIAPGGMLSVATDHDDYAEIIEQVANASADFERSPTFYSQTLLPDPTEPLTEFERKYLPEGRAKHRFTWRRR